MPVQEPPQQPPPPLECQRDHKGRLCDTEVTRRTNEAEMLTPRAELHELLTLTIAATVRRPEECVTFHVRAQTALLGQSYKWEAKEAKCTRPQSQIWCVPRPPYTFQSGLTLPENLLTVPIVSH